LAFYETYGVEEYYTYDPDDGTLKGWLRVNDRLEPVPDMAGFVSPRLGIRFEPGEGMDNLTILTPDGKPFLTYSELVEQIEAAEQHADLQDRQIIAERQKVDAERQKVNAERQKVDAERQKREAERQRAERYAAKLRELGIEPD
jgi:hypothetical protein